MMNTLPNNWILTTLEKIGQIISGGTPSTSNFEYWGGNINWISPVDLSKYSGKYILKGGKSITKLGLEKSSAKLMPKGSVLFSSRAPIGYVAIAGNEMCTNQGFKSIIPNSTIFNEYLYYYLKSAKNKAENLASGTTFKEISLSNFSILEIPLAPIAEQKRIVAKIEELFSELDKGIETLKTAQQQLKVYRQAVLKYAFEGRLTNPDVKEGELPEGWIAKTISELGKVKGGKRLPKGHDYSDSKTKYPYLRVTDFKNLSIDKKRLKYLKEDTHLAIKNYTISKDDVYISIAGSIGFVGTIPIDLDGANLTENAAKITGLTEISNIYLALYLSSGFAQEQISEHTIATTQPKLSLFRIEKIKVTYPISKIDQSSIIQEIESRLSVCYKIEESIEQGLQQAEALRQSILKKAFEGRLVPQDPNDEPASVLLERINGERQKAQQEKKIKTKKVKA